MTDPLMLSESDIEGGGKEGHAGGLENDFAYHNNVHNASVKIRMGKFNVHSGFRLHWNII